MIFSSIQGRHEKADLRTVDHWLHRKVLSYSAAASETFFFFFFFFFSGDATAGSAAAAAGTGAATGGRGDFWAATAAAGSLGVSASAAFFCFYRNHGYM